MVSDYLLLLLCVVPVIVRGLPTYRHGDGDLFIRDGIVNLVGLTGTVFQVIDYLPVCGTLSGSLTRQTDLSDKCTAAMSSFNTSTVMAGIYDLSGVASTRSPGSGTQLCICGSFGTAKARTGDPKSNGLLCVWVDEKGFEEEWWSGPTETRVASSFQLSAQGKALPRCDSVDLASMSAASLATRTAAVSSATSRTGSPSQPTTHSGASPSASSSTPSTPSSGKKSLNIGAIIAIAVIGGSFILVALLFGYRCWLKPRIEKQRGHVQNRPGSGGTPDWADAPYQPTDRIMGWRNHVGSNPPQSESGFSRSTLY